MYRHTMEMVQCWVSATIQSRRDDLFGASGVSGCRTSKLESLWLKFVVDLWTSYSKCAPCVFKSLLRMISWDVRVSFRVRFENHIPEKKGPENGYVFCTQNRDHKVGTPKLGYLLYGPCFGYRKRTHFRDLFFSGIRLSKRTRKLTRTHFYIRLLLPLQFPWTPEHCLVVLRYGQTLLALKGRIWLGFYGRQLQLLRTSRLWQPLLVK